MKNKLKDLERDVQLVRLRLKTIGGPHAERAIVLIAELLAYLMLREEQHAERIHVIEFAIDQLVEEKCNEQKT